jgi:L-threonylcarbamoyladenylate synthase
MSETQCLQIAADHPDPQLIEHAASLIRAGDLVAFPTETVYGLGANGLDAKAVAKIFAAKGRPSSDPLILHLAEASQLPLVAQLPPQLKPMVELLIKHCWPGPLTLVLPKQPAVPSNVTAGGPTVALRVPAHPVAQALIRAAGVPLAAPSANRFARPSPTSAQAVLDDLAGRLALVLDAGPTSLGLESTVLGFLLGKPVLLRPGALTHEALEALIGPVLLPGEASQAHATAHATAHAIAPSPGMMLRHYSPNAKVWLLRQPEHLPELLQQAQKQFQRVGVLAQARFLPASTSAHTFSLGDTPAQAAAQLFHGLRHLDALGVEVILTHLFPPQGLGLAINDRLYRAAVGEVIE